MNVIVKKFGGTSVGNVERIKRVAGIIANSNQKVIIVVSAMSGMTNELVQYTNEIHSISNSDEISEYDAVISAGEQITVGLLSLALMSLGLKSKSYLGWQVPIKTNSDYAKAKILEISTDKLFADLENNVIPVIAGFQGLYNDRVTTLGRGGSDTTAVAVAVAIKASRCDIYTDVDGIFTSDPRIVTKAKKISTINYSSVLQMASSGAKVIHPRAVEIAMQNNVPIKVLNTFSDDSGTQIIDDKNMEETSITGIAIKKDLVMLTLSGVSNSDIDLFLIDLLEIGVMIESMNQSNMSLENFKSDKIICDYNLIFSAEYFDRVMKLIEKLFLNQDKIIIRDKLSKISIIGIGVKNDNVIVKTILETLYNISISPVAIQLLETQLSFIVEQIFTDQVVRTLHTKLGLDIE